jgi:hypothetical protein
MISLRIIPSTILFRILNLHRRRFRARTQVFITTNPHHHSPNLNRKTRAQ